MWTKKAVDEILEHINAFRSSMAEMRFDIAEIRHSIIQMSEAFERMTKQVTAAVDGVYVEAPSICPDLNEDHYA
jgi:methyl-accepting chemotaxis protein